MVAFLDERLDCRCSVHTDTHGTHEPELQWLVRVRAMWRKKTPENRTPAKQSTYIHRRRGKEKQIEKRRKRGRERGRESERAESEMERKRERESAPLSGLNLSSSDQ